MYLKEIKMGLNYLKIPHLLIKILLIRRKIILLEKGAIKDQITNIEKGEF